jgi:hypothetical protein
LTIDAAIVLLYCTVYRHGTLWPYKIAVVVGPRRAVSDNIYIYFVNAVL